MSLLSFGAKLELEPGSWSQLLIDVGIGGAVGACHSFYVVAVWWYDHLLGPILRALKLVEESKVEAEEDHSLKVVAVGYGRTGTYSLKLALDDLGFPTLHTQHLYEHQQIMGMWTDQVFLPSIRSRTTTMGKPNFDLIRKNGFVATADLPMALYFEEIQELYPDCKFILTTRENSEVWFRSWTTLTTSITETTNLGGFFFSTARRYSQYLRWLYSVVNKDPTYLTIPSPLPPQNKEVAIQSYEEHNSRVREIIKPHNLLEYDVKQGWEPLCTFLEISDCPTTPFPKTNSARQLQTQAMSAFLAPLFVSLFVLCYGLSQLFRRLTGMTVVQWVNWKSKELNMTLRKVMLGEKIDHNVTMVAKKI